ncbi:hypothetical protein GN316_04010 [Xylophilus sp. Kf1]|nr:hypothetical protein [Xylophilus sp. Kf1]
MTFPFFSFLHKAPKPATTTGGQTAGNPPATAATTTGPAATSHPGMPPADVSDGHAASYGYADPAALDWQADLPGLATAWSAIDRLASAKVFNSDFGTLDARNQLLAILGIDRATIDQMRAADRDTKKRAATVNAMHGFASSARPDPALLDRANPPFRLLDVLAMLDQAHVAACADFLVPILTLLVLRHAGAGDRYDTAVLARHQASFAHLGEAFAQADQAQYQSTQDHRHAFVEQSEKWQAEYRRTHADRAPPDTGHLPEAARDALQRLGDAYRLDMSLDQKTNLVSTLEATFGVKAETSEDISPTLERLLRWYENARPNSSPPPPSQLMGLVVAVGWQGFQDEKCLREGHTVKLTLTGHPALPDALRAAMIHYMPATPPTLSLMHAGTPPEPQTGPLSPAAAHLSALLAQTPQAGPRRLAQLIERAIALSGTPWLDRVREDHLAAASMTAELHGVATSAEQCEAISQAVASLTDVMQQVVHSANPLYRAFTLDLYRSLGVAASDASRAKRLNTVFHQHPEISPAKALQLVERFAQGMVVHGYTENQAAALRQDARKLHPHWEACAPIRLRIEQAHDKALETVIEPQMALAGQRKVAQPPRLGATPPQQMVAALIAQFGFTDEMLRQLVKDLHAYQLFGSVDSCKRIEARYRAVLRPPGGSMTGTPMAAAIRKLSGAITTHLAAAPPSISIELANLFDRLGGPDMPAHDLHQLLRYFWRLDAEIPVGTPLDALRKALDTLKNDRCFSSAGDMDIAQACEFNNAARENIVQTLSRRVPGFGATYADALDSTAGKDYGAVMATMQAMLSQWTMPERSY